jgi:Ca2+-binding RTX toxin-like protein
MNFPYRDSFGNVDETQRAIHLRESVTVDALIQHSQGKTLRELQFEERQDTFFGIESERGLGPTGHRYIRDVNNPGRVIDMRHFLDAASTAFGQGEPLGAGVEILQDLDNQNSAWQKEDLNSNFLGAVFRNNYYDPNGNISQQFQEFFNDYEKHELKGIVPAVEYLIDDVIDLGRDAQRALQELGDTIQQQSQGLSQQLQNRINNALDNLRSSIDPPAYAGEVQDNFNLAGTQSSPLVLDLDGDGIELTAKEDWLVRFDIDGDGFREATGWVKSDDGLLVFDKNNDGYINDKSELFGNNSSYSNGFEALKVFDTDQNNIINASDTNFSKLRVWRDLDGDGYSDVQELFTLAELGISSIKTTYSNVNIPNAGNSIKQTSSFVMNGQEKTIVDAWFTIDQFNSYYDPISTFNQPIVITQEILSLPNLKGYGNLPDLQIAMAKDEQLLSLVKSFSDKTSQGSITDARGLIRSIMLRWAGTDGISSTSRGLYVNAQEIGFLEKFVGQNWKVGGIDTGSPNPGLAAGTTLSKTFTQLLAELEIRLLTQAVDSPVDYNTATEKYIFPGDVTDAIGKFNQIIAQSAISPSYTLDIQALALSQFIRQQGGEYSNWIVGNVGDDKLIGDTPNQAIYGFSGQDSLNGGAGDDSLNGGADNDTVVGGSGNDLYYGGSGNDLLDDGYPQSGQDTLDGGVGSDTLKGMSGDDTYMFNKGYGQDLIEDYNMVYTTYLAPYVADGGTSDRLIFGAGITRSNLVWSFNGKDLTFTLTDSVSDKLTIANYVDRYYRIENIQLGNSLLTTSEIMTSRIGEDSTAINSLNWTDSAIAFKGLVGNDTLKSGDYGDQLWGDDGDDQITANGGNDSLDGGNNNDSLDGGAGDDSLNGGADNDTVVGGAGNDLYYGGNGNDLLDDGYPQSGQDTLDGGVGSDTLKGMSGDDTYMFNKGYGQDLIEDYNMVYTTYIAPYVADGGTSDRLIFGAGITRSNLVWSFNGKDLTFTLTDSPNDKLTIANYADSFYRIENFQVAGSPLTTAEIIGLKTWTDTSGTNYLSWLQSKISYQGLTGNDTITTGSYDDAIWGDDGNDSLNGGAGNDTLSGGFGFDTLIGGEGNDSIKGDNDNDVLYGGAGNDTLNGSAGIDTLDGGSGNDTYTVDNLNDQINETSATTTEIDTVNSSVNWTLGNYLEKLTLTGSSAINGTGNTLDNTLTGNSGNNQLDGGVGNDTLMGGSGNDLLKGGSGNDRLTGGAGSDRFIYDTNAVFTADAVGTDQITDFVSGTDKIVLDKTTFTALGSVVGGGFNLAKEFAVVGSDTGVATAEALIVYSSETGNLFYNQNGITSGLGSGAQLATLTGIPALGASDFELQA